MTEDNQHSDDYYLELSASPVRFESVSKVTNVFFDDSNRQVFAVRSGGVTGVIVKGPTDQMTKSFRMEDKGPVISIKFSPDQQVLAIQRTKTSVEFENFLSGDGMDSVEYSQSCKGKNTVILGFVWTHTNEILFVTDHGVELFQVVPEKHCLKALKTHSLSVNWFVFCPQSNLVLLSSGTLGNQMQPLHFKPANIIKLTKFEIELGVVPKPAKLCLFERDVTLATLYGIPSIVVLRHQPRGVTGQGAEVVIYTIHKMLTAKKSHILRLDMTGRFAVNVVDNLIVVHHQASKTSMLFDINMPGESDGFVTYHQPVASPRPIKPFSLRLPVAAGSQILGEPAHINCELYSPNWVVFQPNIVIDAKLGCLWYVGLRLYPLVNLIQDKCLLIDFLLQRKDSKPVVIQVLQNILEPTEQNRGHLVVIAELFDHLNDVYRSFLEVEMQSQMGTPASVGLGVTSTRPMALITPKAHVVVDQSDMYTNVFSRFSDSRFKDDGGKFVIWVLLEYIRSLTDFHIPVQHYLHELVINSLVQHKAYYQLHQLLQYHVVSDSKPLAFMDASISIEKIDHPKLRGRMNKYIPGAGNLPTTVRPMEGYVPQIMKEKKERVKDERVAILCDKMTDRKEQYVYVACGDSTVQKLFVACLLLSLENLYPAAHQLALDMLKRLSTANEEIIEVLLSKQQILPALRFVRSIGMVDQVSARKFLEAAKLPGNPTIFYAVFKFFEQRNQRLKGMSAFSKGEHCEVYVKHYQALFNNDNNATG